MLRAIRSNSAFGILRTLFGLAAFVFAVLWIMVWSRGEATLDGTIAGLLSLSSIAFSLLLTYKSTTTLRILIATGGLILSTSLIVFLVLASNVMASNEAFESVPFLLLLTLIGTALLSIVRINDVRPRGGSQRGKTA